MSFSRDLLRLGLSACLLSGQVLEAAVSAIRFEGDAAPPESYVPQSGGTGSVAFQDGVATLVSTGNTGSVGYMTSLNELAAVTSQPFALGIRVRVDVTGSANPAYSGAVIGFTWNDPMSMMFIGINETTIRWGPNIGSLDAIPMPLDGTAWNTIVVENDTTEMKLWANGSLLASRPHSDFPGFQTNAFLQFAANPKTIAEYDYIRFATGPDAMDQVAVPEISSAWLAVVGLGLIARRRR